MKDGNRKQVFIRWLTVTVILAAAARIGVAVTEGSMHVIILTGWLLPEAIYTQAVLVRLMRRSMRENFYSFNSVALAGGILFEALLAVTVLLYLVRGIRNPALFSMEELGELFLGFPRRFSYYATGFVSVLSLAVFVSNLSLMRHEGYRSKNALGALLGFLYLAVTTAAYLITDYLHDNVYNVLTPYDAPMATALYTFLSLTVLVTLCYSECAFLGSLVMGVHTLLRKAAPDKDYVIIPGCMIRKDGTPTPLLRGRVDRAVAFSEEQERLTGKAAMLIPSGGQGYNEVISEAASMTDYLTGTGFPAERILQEDRSLNTAQNMQYSKLVAEKHDPSGTKFAYATTNYHVFRSGICALEAGLDAEGLSAPTKWYFWPNGAIREYFAIIRLNKAAHMKAVALITICCAFIGAVTYLSYL